MLATGRDVAYILSLTRIHLTEHLVLQQLGEADDRVHRGSQLMAHVGEEEAFSLRSRFCCGFGRQKLLLRPLAPGDIRV